MTDRQDGRATDMLQGWVVIAVALAYIGLLFLVASYGDRKRGLGRSARTRLLIYPLSLAIYCTSWTFFGSVGSASRTGYEFLTIYIGPMLMVGLGGIHVEVLRDVVFSPVPIGDDEALSLLGELKGAVKIRMGGRYV